MSYETILTETDGPLGIVTLNRPKVLNALNRQLMTELVEALKGFDADDDIRCIVLLGSDRAFAAGADINELAEAEPIGLLFENRFATWDSIRSISKPIVAGVSGYCLGGGCELAMSCDIIVAAESATFGQPEINIGVIPGAGGTQRMTRAVGKAKAMDVILSGRFLTAPEAEQSGLVSRVVADPAWREETLRLARQVATKSPVALRVGKECVLKAFDSTLDAGLEFERRSFYLLFASHDQREGMAAFIDKRQPIFSGR